jgi:hypothetical protein
MFRQGDSQMFKKYSQMKLQMKREALQKLNRQANEMTGTLCCARIRPSSMVLAQFWHSNGWKWRIRFLECAEML